MRCSSKGLLTEFYSIISTPRSCVLAGPSLGGYRAGLRAARAHRLRTAHRRRGGGQIAPGAAAGAARNAPVGDCDCQRAVGAAIAGSRQRGGRAPEQHRAHGSGVLDTGLFLGL